MNDKTIGVGITGSACSFAGLLPLLQRLRERNRVIPILSPAAMTQDTRFFAAKEFCRQVEEICGEPLITTIPDAEPLGPKKLLDVLLLAPCTSNTMAKLCHGITDTPVLMAAKSHLRNGGPLVIAPFTNDALAASAQNIGCLLARKQVFFVPFRQDTWRDKPRSMTANWARVEDALDAALHGQQVQPILEAPL